MATTDEDRSLGLDVPQPAERVVLTPRGRHPLYTGRAVVLAEPLELIFEREGQGLRRWQLVASLDRRAMLELFQAEISPITPAELLYLDPFKPVRVVLEPNRELGDALDAVQDHRSVVNPTTGLLDPAIKDPVLDLRRSTFVEATSAG